VPARATPADAVVKLITGEAEPLGRTEAEAG
jgi:hypothetical protein